MTAGFEIQSETTHEVTDRPVDAVAVVERARLG